METIHEPAECWKCGYVVDAATSIDEDATPTEGDVSVCIACGVPGVFVMTDRGLSLSKPTLESELEIYQNETVKKLIFAVRYAKSKDPNWPKGPREKEI